MAVAYPVTRNLVVSVGALYSQFRDTPLIPIAGLIWTINERLTLNLIAPDPALVYRLPSGTEFLLKGEFTGTTARIGDDLPSDYEGGELDYTDWRAAVGARFGGDSNWSVSLDAGWSFLRRFQFDDRGEEHDLDGAPYLRAEVRWSF